jgi:hypothetical protein
MAFLRNILFCLSDVSLQRYTDTKLTALFRAGARMSVIKLILARNMISCCGLNKTHRYPGRLQGFF